jgi:protein-disulfide isomerase
MRRHGVLVLLGLVALAASTSTAGSPAAVAWDKIIGADLGALDATQKGRVESILGTTANTRGCKGTLASCLAAGDQTARRHAGFVARMVRKGKPDDAIIKGIADRAASAFPDEIMKIDVADHPLNGAAEAKVALVEFACFECPFCAHLAPQLATLKQKFGDKVAHYYKFFPVRSHARGVPSALAGLAAHRQGKFWKMAELMFANRADLTDDDILGYASQAGLDVARFKADIADAASMKYIEKDKLEGMRLGVEGTPTFFVNGKLYRGLADFDELTDRIGEEIDILEGRIN